MKKVVVFVLVLGTGILTTNVVHGQILSEPWPAGIPRAQSHPMDATFGSSIIPHTHPSATAPAQARYERVATGTLLGAAAGGAAGLAVVALLRGDPGDANMFPWADLAAGAVLGSIPGMYLGARLSNERRGNPFLTGTSAVGGTALGLVAGLAVGTLLAEGNTGLVPVVLGTALGIAVPVGLTSFVEWRTAN
jgi:hypothetical protein